MQAKNLVYQFLLFSLFLFGFPKSISAQTYDVDLGLEIKSLTEEMNSALSEQLDVLSPDNFTKANAHLQKARINLDKQLALKREAHNQLALARDFLGNAYATSTIAKKEINDVVVARLSAIAAEAPRFFPNDFKKTDAELLKTTKALEKNEFANTESSRLPLRVSYSDLELRSIRHQHLAPAGVAILQAIKEGAKQYAPTRLDQLVTRYKEVSDYIRNNRTNVDEIKARSVAIVENANQLLQSTRAIVAARNPERPTIREDVVTTRQASVESLNVDAQVKRIQNQFKASEAEVYRDGNTVYFRLRGLKFPESVAVMKNENLRLLGKVQKAIKGFNIKEVIVEGHTDNVGNRETNEKISVERAQTIKKYLLSIDAVAANKISARGRAEETPIASNATPEGRAQNRRVDIIVKL